jgi:hypothetical protein
VREARPIRSHPDHGQAEKSEDQSGQRPRSFRWWPHLAQTGKERLTRQRKRDPRNRGDRGPFDCHVDVPTISPRSDWKTPKVSSDSVSAPERTRLE